MITNFFEVLQVVKYLFGGFGQVFFTTCNLMFNYMKYFEFVTTIFENHMFKILHIYSSKSFVDVTTCKID